ncbi:hypothetical protein QR685DRAFT_528949, partial [Neurospora intermedia]
MLLGTKSYLKVLRKSLLACSAYCAVACWTATYRMEHPTGNWSLASVTGFRMTGSPSGWEDPGRPLVGGLSARDSRPNYGHVIGPDETL